MFLCAISQQNIHLQHEHVRRRKEMLSGQITPLVYTFARVTQHINRVPFKNAENIVCKVLHPVRNLRKLIESRILSSVCTDFCRFIRIFVFLMFLGIYYFIATSNSGKSNNDLTL